MKRWKKVLLGIGITISVFAALIAVFLVLFGDIRIGPANAGRFTELERTGFVYNGRNYRAQAFQHSGTARFLGGIEGHSSGSGIYAIKGDNNRDFLYVTTGFRGFKGTYVCQGVVIPTSGTVTEVFSGFRSSTTDFADIAMFERIASLTGEMIEFEVDYLNDTRKFYFAYDNWPVATHSPGFIEYADGNLLFVRAGDSYYIDFPSSMAGAGRGIVITDPDILRFLETDPLFLLPGSYRP